MVMRPRHALAAAAILTAVTLGSWTALSTDSPKPTPQAAAPISRTRHLQHPPHRPPSNPARRTSPSPTSSGGTKPSALCSMARPTCQPRPAGLSRIAGDFDGDHARDQLLAYAELNAAGQPRQWHVRVVLASGHIADLALDNTSDWIGPNGLVARRAVDANGDGRDEGFVTSTGGASNDAYNLFGLTGCQVRQVRVAANGPLQILVGGSVGHAEGFDCQSTDRHGRRLLTLWGVERADQQPDGGSAYTYTKTSYRWVGNTLVRQVGTDHGGFATVADGLPGVTSDQGRDHLPSRVHHAVRWWHLVTGLAGSTEADASWQPTLILAAAHCCLNVRAGRRSDELDYWHSGQANERQGMAIVLQAPVGSSARLFIDVRVSGCSSPSTPPPARPAHAARVRHSRSPSVWRIAARLLIEAQGVGVVVAEHPPAAGQGLLVQLAGALEVAQVPRVTARLFTEVRVLGWSSPSTRRRPARVCSCRWRAPCRSPSVPAGRRRDCSSR